jgi:DNA-binding NarL/FixJ family response regulator
MPVMDGKTVTRFIREQYPRIQVVILTNSYEDCRTQAALDTGAYRYLQKGVTVVGIADAIRAAAQSNCSA